jgi:hypothetical protein
MLLGNSKLKFWLPACILSFPNSKVCLPSIEHKLMFAMPDEVLLNDTLMFPEAGLG